MRYLYIFILLILFSCNTKRELQLPEIQNAKVTEIFDVSPAYIFYDETQPDSTFFNRTNLIGTTNWLVNVDKRLTLEQAIPHIQYLQNKRKKAGMHKNENAKNYFTCNDTSIKNLGFLEFTDVKFIEENSIKYHMKISEFYLKKEFLHLNIKTKNEISFIEFGKEETPNSNKVNLEDLIDYLKSLNLKPNYSLEIFLNLNSQMSFQDYISILSKTSSLGISNITFANKQFFY